MCRQFPECDCVAAHEFIEPRPEPIIVRACRLLDGVALHESVPTSDNAAVYLLAVHIHRQRRDYALLDALIGSPVPAARLDLAPVAREAVRR